MTVTRRSAVKAQQAAWRQIGSLLINAPTQLRDRYRDVPRTKLVAELVNVRPDQASHTDHIDTLYALRSLARRHRDLTDEINGLQQRMLALATTANPALMAIKGVGPVVGAQLLITMRRQPRPAPQLGLLRRAVRHRAHPRQLRPHRPPPAIARR